MKVIAFNGSPKAEGNTFHALQLVTAEMEKKGIDCEIVHVGNKAIRGCTACGQCVKKQNEQCVIKDEVNDWIQLMKGADGLLIGSPVYYSGIAGTMKCFLDRAFFVAGVNGGLLRGKVGAAVAAVRRSGGIPTFDQLNHFINYAEMIVPTSNYWNVIHGLTPGEVLQDEEGVQIMQVLGQNMAYTLQLVENGAGKVEMAPQAQKVYTHFIR
jgi:multimeric flavodoxin WrbA